MWSIELGLCTYFILKCDRFLSTVIFLFLASFGMCVLCVYLVYFDLGSMEVINIYF